MILQYKILTTLLYSELSCVVHKEATVTIRNTPFARSLGIHPSRLGGYLDLLVVEGLISKVRKKRRGYTTFELKRPNQPATSTTILGDGISFIEKT